jgi:hydrogenase expression/formation protein HypC
MCLGIPARVTAVCAHPDLVDVDMAGVTRTVNAGLLDDPPRPGEWVLVHMGFVLSTMTEAEARQAVADLDAMAAERLGSGHVGTGQGGPPW